MPDLICLRRSFGERVSEDEFKLERGGCGDKCFVAVLPSMHDEENAYYTRKQDSAYQAE